MKMKMWVLDASVALRWLLRDARHPDAMAVLEHVHRHPTAYAVPELFAFETYSVLGRLAPDPLAAWRAAILPLLTGGVHRHPMTEELAGLGARYIGLGLTGYDASYAALAEQVGGRWLTFDKAAHRRLEASGVSFLLGDGLPDELGA